MDENDFEIMRMIEDKNVIVLLNKSDLKTMVTPKMVKEHLDKPMIEISAKEEEGIYELEQTVKEMFSREGSPLMMRFILPMLDRKKPFCRRLQAFHR